MIVNVRVDHRLLHGQVMTVYPGMRCGKQALSLQNLKIRNL